MSSYARTLQKRMLKKMGFRREPATKWDVVDGKPTLVHIPKHKRQILNPLGVPVGLHYPR